MITVAVVLFSRPGTSSTVAETPIDPKHPNVDAPWILAAYYMTAIAASVAHMTTIFVALTGTAGPDVTMSRIFSPSPRLVSSAAPESYAALKEGVHLFVQYDLMITGAACLVFVHFMLQKISKKDGSPVWSNPERAAKELVYLAVGSAILGPAGAGSFGLAVREKRLRAQLKTKSH